VAIFLENSSDAMPGRPGSKNVSMNCHTTPKIKNT
jgi:hypothetical protein